MNSGLLHIWREIIKIKIETTKLHKGIFFILIIKIKSHPFHFLFIFVSEIDRCGIKSTFKIYLHEKQRINGYLNDHNLFYLENFQQFYCR